MAHKVLIVDDDEDITDLIGGFFPADEFETTTANDGDTACEIADKLKPHLIIADAVMPNKSGLEVIKHVKEVSKDAVVFLMTGFNSVEGKSAYDEGVNIFFRKPVNGEEIVAAARRYLSVDQKKLKNLSKRETEILFLLAEGKTSKEVAQEIGISVATVNKHRENMIRRTDTKNTVDLLAKTLGYVKS